MPPAAELKARIAQVKSAAVEGRAAKPSGEWAEPTVGGPGVKPAGGAWGLHPQKH
jgi:hypothetical protein